LCQKDSLPEISPPGHLLTAVKEAHESDYLLFTGHWFYKDLRLGDDAKTQHQPRNKAAGASHRLVIRDRKE